jgi:two-component system NarL family sensor kinase
MYPFITAQVIAGQQDLTQFVVVMALSFFIMAAFFIGIILNVYRQRVANQKKILDAIYNAQENEKTRIAEDLHDNIGASLSALKLRIGTINEDSTDVKSVALAKESNELLDVIIKDLRVIVRNQASKYLLTNGFKNELIRFRDHFTSNNKIKFEISLSEQLPPLDNQFGINIFRIVQELVNNSIKHSNCTHISLELKKKGSEIEMIYNDNGIGFDPEVVKKKGMGLSNIRARVKLFNGKYQVKTAPGINTKYNFVFDSALAI